MKKKWIALFLSCVMAASLCACGGDEEEAASPSVSAASGEEGTWSIYWYLCGSDLESKHGAASADLEEMFQIQPPKGVKVVVQTGGAKAWKREEIPSV